MQKAELEAQVIRGPVTRSSVRSPPTHVALLLLVLVVYLVCSVPHPSRFLDIDIDTNSNLNVVVANVVAKAASCAQADPRAPPPSPVLDSVFATQFSLANASYSNQVATRLAGLVRIRSESFDDMKTPPSDPDTDDPRRAGLVQIRDYLRVTYPLVHEYLNLEIVNYYGLVYTWTGSDSSLKPVMVTAHQDTVPVDTSSLDKWTFPPFEGRIENGYIWGRGSADCKAQIVSIMDAVETLLLHNHAPTRTILIAFGFDEEISGRQGSGEITKHLEAKGYGNQQIEFILDEGSSVENQYGASFALLSTGERGYMDIEYSVRTIGGHSSIPPDHTAIGFLAKIISALEDHPYKPTIAKDLNRSPFFNELMCGVEHGPDMDPTLKKALEKAAISNKASKKLISILTESPKRKSLLTTSQAIDIVSGGVKVNALPEVATAIGNYRIHIDESVKSTEERVLGIVSTVAKKFNLTVEQRTATGDVFFVGADGRRVQNAAAAAPSLGLVSIVTLDDSLEPAPITPTTGKPFQLVAGTIRQAMVRGDEKLFVAPSLPTGNSGIVVSIASLLSYKILVLFRHAILPLVE
ncbi:hypothetical protein HDU79_000964 [Rhizoclosmatium sp. JEL0117]|nr:hypothetical protein HDU79_000964 [Rhizoclosmatium sp. JEL0117]